MSVELEIRNLHARVEGEDSEILRGVNLTVRQGEIHALMGPNGSGKSTLANVLMGNPTYEVTKGEIVFDGTPIEEMETDERSRAGLFLAFQYPVSIPGVTLANFLRHAINSRLRAEDPETKGIPIPQFARLLRGKMDDLGIDHSFAGRYLNEGFSGGEKKRAEVLQMAVLEPKIAILDETDSGLDIDALRVVAEGVQKLTGPTMGALVITHYQRMLDYVKPNFVHVMFNGRIVESNGPGLALQLEERGYDWIREKYAPAAPAIDESAAAPQADKAATPVSAIENAARETAETTTPVVQTDAAAAAETASAAAASTPSSPDAAATIDTAVKSIATEAAASPATDSTSAPATDSTNAPATDSTSAPATDSTNAPATEAAASPATDSTNAPAATEAAASPATDSASAPAATEAAATPTTDSNGASETASDEAESASETAATPTSATS